jgi:hypothetical protein
VSLSHNNSDNFSRNRYLISSCGDHFLSSNRIPPILISKQKSRKGLTVSINGVTVNAHFYRN